LSIYIVLLREYADGRPVVLHLINRPGRGFRSFISDWSNVPSFRHPAREASFALDRLGGLAGFGCDFICARTREGPQNNCNCPDASRVRAALEALRDG
jgi:hypothetical protein